MKRKSGWEDRFSQFINRMRKQVEFSWGGWNCCTVSLTGVEQLIGVNIWDREIGPVSNKQEALKAIAKASGGKGLEEAVHNTITPYGCIEIPVKKVGRGDLVMVRDARESLLCIVDLSGREALALHPEKGFYKLPLSQAYRAWKVG